MSDSKPSVLVVDDSDVFRYSIKNFLKDFNVNVIACFDGLEGIRKAMEHKPVLIILDLMMPNFDGIKMLQVIKVIEELRSVPVVVISGNTNKSNVIAALENGADRVFSKPLQRDVIVKYIKETLGDKILPASSDNNGKADNANREILSHLSRFFATSFTAKKEQLLNALIKEDREALSSLIHEIKGAGGTIGHPEISVMCYDIEKSMTSGDNWNSIKGKCSRLIDAADKINIPAEV